MNTMLSPQREDIVAEIARINEIEDREELLARFHDYWRNAKINIHFMVQLIKRFEGLGFEFTQQDETECRMLPLLRQIAADQIDMELAQRCLSKDDATANRLFGSRQAAAHARPAPYRFRPAHADHGAFRRSPAASAIHHEPPGDRPVH